MEKHNVRENETLLSNIFHNWVGQISDRDLIHSHFLLRNKLLELQSCLHLRPFLPPWLLNMITTCSIVGRNDDSQELKWNLRFFEIQKCSIFFSQVVFSEPGSLLRGSELQLSTRPTEILKVNIPDSCSLQNSVQRLFCTDAQTRLQRFVSPLRQTNRRNVGEK